MKLIERQIPGRALTVVRVVERWASAVLELHSGYYTYYWRCLYGQQEFIRSIYRRQHQTLSKLTLFDAAIGFEQLRLPEASGSVSRKLRDKSFNTNWSLVRFDESARSWVWQYAPDTASDEVYARIGGMAGGYPHNEGLLAYICCVSTGDHMANFREANKYLAESAVDHDLLLPYTDRFERYLNHWSEENEKSIR